MWVRHVHMWTEVRRKFVEPAGVKITAKGFYDPEHINKLAFGFTIIESKCTICQEPKFVEVNGDMA
jgi:hypothetical protein